jgi:hypothetical protein
MNENYAFLSYLEIDTDKIVITPEIDIMKVINNHSLDEAVNPHSCNPVYLKLTEAEEKFHVNI